MPTLAIVTLTRNEAKYIDEFIKCAQLCEPYEFIVVDDNSEDDTVEIATARGVTVYKRALNGDFGAQVNFAMSKVTADYIFYLESDEFVNPELAAEIRRVVASGEDVVCNIERRNIAFGEKVLHGVLKPDRVQRIYPRGKATWPGIIHLRLKHSLPILELKSFVWHHTYKTWEQYWRKFDIYTTVGAQQDYERGKRATKANAFLHALGGFFKMFILKKGILDGYIGWVLCCNHFTYTLAKYNKLYLLQQKNGGQ